MKYSKKIGVFLVALAIGLPAIAVSAQTALPCYVSILKSCAAISINPDRMCGATQNIPCGDVIINDDYYTDITIKNLDLKFKYLCEIDFKKTSLANEIIKLGSGSGENGGELI